MGITNQRQTTVAWDRHTGQPFHKAIVWCDNRTAGTCSHFKRKLGSLVRPVISLHGGGVHIAPGQLSTIRSETFPSIMLPSSASSSLLSLKDPKDHLCRSSSLFKLLHTSYTLLS